MSFLVFYSYLIIETVKWRRTLGPLSVPGRLTHTGIYGQVTACLHSSEIPGKSKILNMIPGGWTRGILNVAVQEDCSGHALNARVSTVHLNT